MFRTAYAGSWNLISRAVFGLVLVAQHIQIRLVARRRQAVLLKRLQHGAARLVRMGAVAKAAVGRELEYVTEIMRQLLRLNIKRAEALYPRNVDERSAVGMR